MLVAFGPRLDETRRVRAMAGFRWSMFHHHIETGQLGGHRHSVADLKDGHRAM